MIKSAFNISKRILYAVFVLSAGLMSCTDDVTGYPGTGTGDDDDTDKVRVGASVKDNVYSRSYRPSGPVDEGDFYLTYPFTQKIVQGDTTYTYSLADVRFGTNGAETMGFVTYEGKDGKPVDLKWSDVTLRKGNTAVFYLDNVSPTLNDATNTKEDQVLFRAGEEIPFQGGVFDLTDGYNDLLWGTAEAPKNAKKVDFVLHHNMSRFRIIINVKPREDNGVIVDLSHVAKMELSNLQLRPESFDRTTGNLILPTEPVFKKLDLIDINNKDAENNGSMLWESIDDDDSVKDDPSTYKAKVYTTQDFVLPPQELFNDSNRPRLSLTIPAEYAGEAPTEPAVVYEALLPQNMYASETGSDDDDDDVTSNRRPMPLSFMKEHILTIKATIGPPDMVLEFAPVVVEDWVDMGEHNVTGQQAGIYNNDDFMDFLKCYKDGNKVLLEKYGYTSGKDDQGNDKWIILFWSKSINLEKSEIENYLKDSMHEDMPFSFSFNNYVIKVSGWDGYGDLSGAAGQIRLYNLITGSNLSEPGITTLDQFMDMMDAYNRKNSSLMQKYGAYDNYDEQWVFEFTQQANEEFVLSYDEIHGMMKDKEGAGNFAINFRDHTVKVTGLPNGGEMVLSGDEGQALLHAILVAPEGIYSLADIDWLIKAYNWKKDVAEGDGDTDVDPTTEDLTWILALYGTQSGDDKWTFTFRRSMQISGREIYATMVPDAEYDMADYAFTQDSGLTIKVDDTGSTTYLYTPGMANLRKLFAAAGQATTAAELRNVITYHNNGNPIYRRFYGWYREEDKKWQYPVNGTFEIPYTDLFNKITSTDLFEVIMIGESKVTITGMPNGLPDLICRGQQGADIITAILRGTYRLDYPDPGLETKGDFTNLFTAYNNNSKEDMLLYGDYSDADNKWIFTFTPTAPAQIEISYNDIYNNMNSNSAAGEFAFSFGDHVVKVTDLPGATSLLLTGETGEALLHSIVTGGGSVESTTDLDWLVDAYNAKASSSSLLALSGDTDWLLNLYGTNDGSGWTFNIGARLNLEGADVYGNMKPDTAAGKPEYQFTYGSSAGVQVTDGAYSESVTSANLKKLFAENGQVTSAADLTALAACGENTIIRRYYGTPNAAGRWAYTLTNSCNVAYQDIFGKMTYNFGLTFDSGVSVTLTALPAGYRPIVCEGAQGPALLTSILDGTYKPADPGILDTQDVADLITAYNAKNTNNMMIYGVNSGSNWTFTFRNTMQLTGTDIYGKMVPDAEYDMADYSFALASATVSVTDNGTTEQVSAEQLKVLFANGGKITSASDLTAMIACDENPITRRYYGTMSGSKWQYPITTSFSVPYSSVFNEINYDFGVTLDSGVKITLTDLPAGYRPIVCEGTAGATVFQSILDGTYKPADPGIESTQDVTDLIAAYNAGNTANMQIYGSTNGGSTWTFTFRNSMTLTGSTIYGQMIPEPEGTKPAYKPAYEFAMGSATVKVSDGRNTETVNAANLKILFTNGGQITSADDLTAMFGAVGNPITSRYYGTVSGSSWTYPVSASFSIAYNQIFDKVDAANAIAFALSDGVKVTVTGVPNDNDDIDCTGIDGAATLLSIVNGSYVPKEPETGGGDGGDTDPGTQP